MKEIVGQEGIIQFSKDFHPEFEGHICKDRDGVWISSIHSKNPDKGNFSKLVKELKEQYNWIRIPTPSNEMVIKSTHLGFTPKSQYFGYPFFEIGCVMYWSKEK